MKHIVKSSVVARRWPAINHFADRNIGTIDDRETFGVLFYTKREAKKKKREEQINGASKREINRAIRGYQDCEMTGCRVTDISP